MKRTTIVLTDELAALLERERRRRGISAAAIVRDALDAYFGRHAKPLAIAALGRSGYTNIAQEVEEILAEEWTYERLVYGDEQSAPGHRMVAEGGRPGSSTTSGEATDGTSGTTAEPRQRGRAIAEAAVTGQAQPAGQQSRPT